jgi:cell division protease FtsH
VMEYGMSPKLGWLRYRDNQEEVFLGHSVARSQNVSAETARMIDEEVRRFVEEGENVARQVLTDNIDELHRLAAALLEYETLSGDEAKRAIAGQTIGRDDDRGNAASPISGHAGSLPQIKRKPKPFGDASPQGV